MKWGRGGGEVLKFVLKKILLFWFCGVFWGGRVLGPGEEGNLFWGVLEVWDGEFIMSIL
jgi:hypothetical protein